MEELRQCYAVLGELSFEQELLQSRIMQTKQRIVDIRNAMMQVPGAPTQEVVAPVAEVKESTEETVN